MTTTNTAARSGGDQRAEEGGLRIGLHGIPNGGARKGRPQGGETFDGGVVLR